jgi:hypothetical protein
MVDFPRGEWSDVITEVPGSLHTVRTLGGVEWLLRCQWLLGQGRPGHGGRARVTELLGLCKLGKNPRILLFPKEL